MVRIAIVLGCLLPVAFPASVPAADAPTRPAEDGLARTQDARVTRLIRRLGARKYADRVAASRELRRIGSAALDALRDAAQSAPGAEVRARAGALVEDLLERAHNRRLDAFRRGEKGAEKGLPAWPLAKELLGDGNKTRAFYVAMLKAEPELFGGLQKNPEWVGSALQAVATRVRTAALRNTGKVRPSLGALLLVALDERVKPSDRAMLYIAFAVRHYARKRKDRTLADDKPLRRLAGRFIERGDSPSSAWARLRLAMQLGLDDLALAVAEDTVLDKRGRSTGRFYAAVVIGEQGSEKHIPLLEKALDDKDTCGTIRRGKKKRWRVQVRDVALAALLELTGQDRRDYGYPKKKTSRSSRRYYRPTTNYAFGKEQTRRKAFAKWEAWRKEHPPKQPTTTSRPTTQPAEE